MTETVEFGCYAAPILGHQQRELPPALQMVELLSKHRENTQDHNGECLSGFSAPSRFPLRAILLDGIQQALSVALDMIGPLKAACVLGVVAVAFGTLLLWMSQPLEERIVRAETQSQALGQLSPRELGQIEKTRKYGEATLIVPHRIYLGSYWNSADSEFLTTKNVSKIFHFASGRPVMQVGPSVNQVFSYRLRYVTSSPEDQFNVFREATSAIHRSIQANDTVLVHCMRGRSRSVSIVIAYLMEYHSLSFDDAREMIKALRPAIGPLAGLRPQLRALEAHLKVQK